MDDIREMTVTVANTHPYLTTPTQENHQLPDQSSTKTPLQEDESGDRGSNVVATAAVGTNLKGVSTMGGGQEHENESKENSGGNQDQQDGTNEGDTDRIFDEDDSNNSDMGGQRSYGGRRPP